MSGHTDRNDLVGWSIGRSSTAEWLPWGSDGRARAQLLASGDGYHVALVEAAAGYRGAPHTHAHAEFLHVLSGTLVTNGERLGPGDAYAAAAGSEHREFRSDEGATYLSVFKI